MTSLLVAAVLCSAQYTLARRTVPVIAAGGGPSTAVIRQGARTTTGTSDFTSSGFGTPQAAIFLISPATTDGTAADGAFFSLGITDGTNHYTVAIGAEHNSQSSDTFRRTETDEVLILYTDNNTVDCEANFDSWITDGVRINFADNACDSAHLVTAILLGGDNVIDAKVGSSDVPCSGGVGATTTVTVTDFRPHVVITVADGAEAAAGTTHVMISVGAMTTDHGGTETIVNRAFAWYSLDNQTSGGNESIHFSESEDTINLGSGQVSRSGNINATSTTSGGDFTMRCNNANNAFDFGYGWLALDLADSYYLQTVTTPASVPNTNNESGAGFEPTGGLMVHSHNTIVGSTGTGDGGIAVSGFATNAYSTSSVSEDASDPTDTQSLSDDVAVYHSGDDGADQIIATHTFDSLGVDLSFTDIIGSNQSKSWMLLLE